MAQRLATSEMLPRDAVPGILGMEGASLAPSTPSRKPDEGLTPGARQVFWVGDVDRAQTYTVTASLVLLGAHLQMWVQDGEDVAPEALARSALAFEERIYPTLRPASCGVAENPRLVVLNARFSGALGYYTASSALPRSTNSHHVQRDVIVLNGAALDPGTPAYEAALAHEYQHLLHARADLNEEAWFNEGCAELAEELCGYGPPGAAVWAFEVQPATQLTTWADDAERVSSHYGAAYLFARYLRDRLGADLWGELLCEPGNGLQGLDNLLARHHLATTADELYSDWTLANALSDPALDDGRYAYPGLAVHAQLHSSVRAYPQVLTGTLAPYSTDYWELLPAGKRTLQIQFEGQATSRVVATDATSGRHFWWSNRGDSGYSYLERSFDLRDARAPVLTFQLWHALEHGWDYGYVRASADGGRTWRWLRGESMTDANPNGVALGPGYTGLSGGGAEPRWVRESVDLASFGGGQALVRWEYLTDDAVNGPGLCLDDIALAAIGYSDDVESGDDVWRAVGFLRHDNRVAVRYAVQVVTFGEQTRVWRMPVGETSGAITLDSWGSDVRRALVAVSPLVPRSTEACTYTLSVH